MIGKLQKRLPIISDDPVALAARVVDSGETDEATNRVTQKCSALTDDMSIVESFSHIITIRTDDGLVCVDSSGKRTGGAAVGALRGWSTDRVNTLIYTHGHVDHVGGSGAMAADATARQHAVPEVIGQENVGPRFDRYRETDGWNTEINRRQFGGISKASGLSLGEFEQFLPEDVLEPTTTYRDHLSLSVGGLDLELHHDRGETDDHTWVWIPEHRAICAGDLVTWIFPNCGNPQKVQRYPKEWAVALRRMQALEPEWLLGAHGLPLHGAERVQQLLGDLAGALERLVLGTIELMNDGTPLDQILQEVTLTEEELSRPWMRPVYDEPEFVVRNIWRLYGGWWDLNPAHLKPSPASALGAEIAALTGGADALAARAAEIADTGDFRLACHLIEFAVSAEPASLSVHGIRAEIYQARRNAEASLMSKGIYAAAANESRARIEAAEA